MEINNEQEKVLVERVKNRCNRVGQLIDLHAPKVILQHECRMTVEAIIALYGLDFTTFQTILREWALEKEED